MDSVCWVNKAAPPARPASISTPRPVKLKFCSDFDPPQFQLPLLDATVELVEPELALTLLAS
jgi:hypothetical protein